MEMVEIMKEIRLAYILLSFCVLLSCSEKQNHSKLYEDNVFECKSFTFKYPKDYTIDTIFQDCGVTKISIFKRNSEGCTTNIIWGNDKFPGTITELVTLLVYKEMHEPHSYYNILNIDSISKYNGHPSYSIASVFADKGSNDTIIRCRIGILVNDTCHIIVEQSAKTTQEREVNKVSVITRSLNIK